MHVSIRELKFDRHSSGAIRILSIPEECRASRVSVEACDSLTCDDSLTPEPGHDALEDRHTLKIAHLQTADSWR